MQPPTWDEAMEGQQRIAVDTLEETIREGKFDEYKNAAKDFLTNYEDSVSVVAAALKLLTKEPDKTPVDITEERPLPSKGDRGSRGGRGGDRNRNRNRNDRRNDRNRRGKQGQSSSSSYGKGNNKQQRRSSNKNK